MRAFRWRHPPSRLPFCRRSMFGWTRKADHLELRNGSALADGVLNFHPVFIRLQGRGLQNQSGGEAAVPGQFIQMNRLRVDGGGLLQQLAGAGDLDP